MRWFSSCFNSQFLDWETIYCTVGSVEAREVVIIGRTGENCESKQASGWSFDSKPTLLCLQLYSDSTGNFVRCLLLSKLKLGLELKQKCPPKPQILNNSYPTFLERLNIYFFRDRGIREFVVALLQVCRVLVLTHNF